MKTTGKAFSAAQDGGLGQFSDRKMMDQMGLL